MKLRIRGNSLRLRLTRSEVRTLAMRGDVGDRVSFSPSVHLDYVLRTDPDAAAPEADYSAGRIEVRLPADAVAAWADGDAVSLSGEQPIDGDSPLTILVEKDFACLRPREGEDESDMFRNPAERC